MILNIASSSKSSDFNEKFLYLSLESSGGASGKLVINPESEKYFL